MQSWNTILEIWGFARNTLCMEPFVSIQVPFALIALCRGANIFFFLVKTWPREPIRTAFQWRILVSFDPTVPVYFSFLLLLISFVASSGQPVNRVD